MPFNFIAHHSCRHCSGHLFYSNRKCYGEEEGANGGGVKGKGLERVSVGSKHMWTGYMGRAAQVPLQGHRQERKM